jgi:hypothetical protein
MCCQGLCIPQHISLSDARKNAPKRALPTRYAGYARTSLGRSPDFPAVLTAPVAYLRLFLVKLATVVKLVRTMVYIDAVAARWEGTRAFTRAEDEEHVGNARGG